MIGRSGRDNPLAGRPSRQHPDGMDTHPDMYADLAEVSQILGLSQEAIRKRLHRCTLEGCKVDGRWMVRLPTGRLDADPDDPANCQDARPRPDALIGRLYRDNLELAGRLGFLQARVQDLEREIRLLQAPASSGGSTMRPPETVDTMSKVPLDPTPAPTPYPPAASANGQDSGAGCPPRRPWWRFWERIARSET